MLDGGTGAELMTGGDGNDIYYVDDAGDVVVEQEWAGWDEVRLAGMLSRSQRRLDGDCRRSYPIR